MEDDRDGLAVAFAVAGQQFQEASSGFDLVVGEAERLLAQYGPAATWTLLTSRYAEQLGCTTQDQQHAVEMLVAAALRAVQET
ncbi:hypothetical protein HS041_36270 [Planomonospora sp. ID67723]|uniref:hypothetical protein n=1 Tax=Planomonospora sp. ID67723 TaxID=2738134 RepID=UPI0018C36627|nr:hypothetical protein [Planomonospora sp. ID67723]MBG0833161.1 hypothetical protein [Planomonospora sp. ID67723]